MPNERSMNLHKTLKAYNEVKTNKKQEDLILKEANSIIENSYKSDLRILSQLGMDKNIIERQNILAERQITAQFDEVYDISAIRKMAVNYGLRFLPSKRYKGTIDPLLPTVLNEFINKHNAVHGRFYILAPAESFNLEERPKDPIILYEINENKYAFVHKWGNDLSNFRWFVNIPFRSCFHFAIFCSLLIASIVVAIAYFQNDTTFLIFLVLSSLGIMGSTTEQNEDKWDSEYL